MTIPIRTLLDIEDVLGMCCFIDRLFYRCMDMCESDTLHTSIYDETDFWTVRSYNFWIIALVSLTDIVMTLSMLTTRCRGDLDSMLIEDVHF